MSSTNSVFDLKPFQEEYIKGDGHSYNTITRVPGGWVYKTFVYDNPLLKEDKLKVISISSVFIPFIYCEPEDTLNNRMFKIELPIH